MKQTQKKSTARECKACRFEPLIITRKLTGRQQRVHMVACSNPDCAAFPATGWHTDREEAVSEWNSKFTTGSREA